MRISVVILLAAISIVNASPFHIYKRAVALEPCDPASTIVLTGTIDPDPAPGAPAKAKTTFTTTADIPKLFLTTTVTDGGDAKTAKVTTADLCASGLECPVPKGKGVEVTSSTEIPADMKAPVIEYNFNDGTTTVACGKSKAAGGAAPPGGAPKGDAPKGDAPKGDAPKGDAPKGDAPKGDAPKGDAPKGDAPKGDAPKGDGPPPPEDAPKGKGDDGPPPEDEPKGGPPPPEDAPKGKGDDGPGP